ncbi:MAG: hypothetical protein HKP38_04055 [Croceitalea sp.]|nr:hypothetical protein [Croceitalea sp.]MBT8239213.1 hypothetical protein [Croceitalea sp.]NNC33582.1 hypothetical protein [Croceitalea sp.]NNL08379.1 hypothetical protein [Croceitalea sp.]NNM17221.1 hypothetical protein [Croceitalea sp.]
MLKKIVVLGFLILIGCQKNIDAAALPYLTGYWEIKMVEFTDGSKKEYTVNPSVDYIELQGMKGYRKKVQPKFDGSFDTSDDAELFEIIKKDENFVMVYKNAWSSWEEKLILLKPNTFVVKNEEGIKYSYKRYEPINIAP